MFSRLRDFQELSYKVFIKFDRDIFKVNNEVLKNRVIGFDEKVLSFKKRNKRKIYLQQNLSHSSQ